MMSNSVTHLRSYTNTAIAGNSAPMSPRRAPMSPAERRCRPPSADVARRAPMSPRREPMSPHRMASVSQCFKFVSWVFTLFNIVLWCLVSCATIGIDPWGITTMPQGSGFGKSTHIPMISNSVIPAELYQLRNRRYRRKLPWASILPWRAPMCSRRAPIFPRHAPVSLHRATHWMANVRVFCDVSQCFKSGSWCFMTFYMYHDVLQVFHDVLPCLTMFYDV